MRVVLVSKALVTGIYQRLAAEIGGRGVDLTVMCPPCWKDSRGLHRLEPVGSEGFSLQSIPIRLNGHFHLHFYPDLGMRLRQAAPDLLHMDEEPYNLATWLGVCHAGRLGIPVLFASWQNLRRTYPPPFSWWEQDVYRRASHALAGTRAVEQVLRSKGYAGDLTINPQMGVDTALFCPAAPGRSTASVSIGYAGGLLPEKGVDVLLRACARLQGDWHLQIAGEGSEEARLRRLAADLGIASSVHFAGRLQGHRMPDFYQSLDIFVLPSRTQRNWKEQFGRVLIEAMACAVVSVASDSGEGRHVVGAAGLVYPEADDRALAGHLQDLMASPALRHRLGQTGRQRVLQHFSMQAVAATVVDVYRHVLGP